MIGRESYVPLKTFAEKCPKLTSLTIWRCFPVRIEEIEEFQLLMKNCENLYELKFPIFACLEATKQLPQLMGTKIKILHCPGEFPEFWRKVNQYCPQIEIPESEIRHLPNNLPFLEAGNFVEINGVTETNTREMILFK